MSAARQENAFVSDKRIVSTDRYLDHYHQLLITTNDAGDVRNFYIRTLQRICTIDPRVTALTGDVPELADDDEYAASTLPKLSEAIHHEVEEATAALLARQQALQEIGTTLLHLHQPPIQKILNEANTALANGMRTSGRDRVEDFKDALRLYRTIQEEGVSGRDYTVWFHLGWLLWKLEENLPEAEEAFYQAARLSASAGDQFHALSLRHLAYMQYLQGKHKPAHSTLVKAVAANGDDPDTLYDAARYAARVGRQAEAMAQIDRCFDRSPLLLVFAFTEPDFVETNLDGAITELIKAKREQALAQIHAEAEQWEAATTLSAEAAARAEIPLNLPAEVTDTASVRSLIASVKDADYFTVRDAARRIVGKTEAVQQAVETGLNESIATFENEGERLRKQLEKLQQDRDTWRGTVKWLEKEAKQAGYELEASGRLENIKLRLQKRHDRVMTARLNYNQSKDNLNQAIASLKEQAPGLQKLIKQSAERKARVEATRDWFLSQNPKSSGH
jgi:tetratricopeptide (TPR) repeat protein